MNDLSGLENRIKDKIAKRKHKMRRTQALDCVLNEIFVLGRGSDGSVNISLFDSVSRLGQESLLDTGNNRVQKFDSNGNFITKWGSTGTADGQFNVPIGIAINSKGIVYVAESNNARVQIFAPSISK
jgi:DNA-binding beta-propeller fold protein YncE